VGNRRADEPDARHSVAVGEVGKREQRDVGLDQSLGDVRGDDLLVGKIRQDRGLGIGGGGGEVDRDGDGTVLRERGVGSEVVGLVRRGDGAFDEVAQLGLELGIRGLARVGDLGL
jgi:hypothetical protein|tara:strand:- start:7651 stop:7995 length:345 start_codon:yes stop_codon:yes gene_type:complete